MIAADGPFAASDVVVSVEVQVSEVQVSEGPDEEPEGWRRELQRTYAQVRKFGR